MEGECWEIRQIRKPYGPVRRLQGLILERINESKGGGGCHLHSVLKRQKPKAPNRNVNCARAGRTGTQNPLLPFLDPLSTPTLSIPLHNEALRLVEMDSSPLNCTQYPRPGSIPIPLDLAKFPETRPLPPPLPPLAIGGRQGGHTGERGFPGRAGFSVVLLGHVAELRIDCHAKGG